MPCSCIDKYIAPSAINTDTNQTCMRYGCFHDVESLIKKKRKKNNNNKKKKHANDL